MSAPSPHQTQPSVGCFATLKNDGYPKTLDEGGGEGTYPHIIKACCRKPTANVILNGDKTESFSPKARSKTGMSPLTHPVPQKWQLSRNKGVRLTERHGGIILL